MNPGMRCWEISWIEGKKKKQHRVVWCVETSKYAAKKRVRRMYDIPEMTIMQIKLCEGPHENHPA